ncbi:MAG: PEP-CTERM sorting domain-containing protein [Bryobacteraceae bacterium]
MAPGWMLMVVMAGAAVFCASNRPPMVFPYLVVRTISSYDVTVDTGDLLSGVDAASVKARYVDDQGNKMGALMSENISLQQTNCPEPSSALMLGAGLLGLSLVTRKLRRQSS